VSKHYITGVVATAALILVNFFHQMSFTPTVEGQGDVRAERGVRSHQALEVDIIGECFAGLERHRSDMLAHSAVDVDARAVVRVNGGLQHFEVGTIGACEDVANIFGGGFVDLGDIVLVGNCVDSDRDKGTLDLVSGGMCDDGGLIVLVGVDELEEELEMLRVVLV
jgi:hypothetical protein